MKVEIITTGSEVMQGVIVDTNTSWIADRCARLGHEVIRHASVGDDLRAIGSVLHDAAGRADVVIVTGGLGPTVDDVTLEAAASAFGVKLVEDPATREALQRRAERSGRAIFASDAKQAFIPKGALALPNSVGSAPGVRMEVAGATLFFLPGVPRELFAIFEASVEPWLSARTQGAHANLVLRCFGLPEAVIDQKLAPLSLDGITLAFRVHFPEVLLRLHAKAKEASQADRLLEAAASQIRGALGEVVYAEGESSLAHVVGTMMLERRLSLAVAESCTGGLIASTITDVSGASQWFERGVVSYSNRSKEEVLGVPKETLERFGAVSAETAGALALGVRRLARTDVGIGVTGIAGPSGGVPEKPVGTVHLALASAEGVQAFVFHFQRERTWWKRLVAWTALDLLRKFLLKSER